MLILDRAPLPEVTASLGQAPDLRVSTLTPSSVRLFTESGAWGDMAPPCSAPFQHMQVLPRRKCCKVPSESYLCIFVEHVQVLPYCSQSPPFHASAEPCIGCNGLRRRSLRRGDLA